MKIWWPWGKKKPLLSLFSERAPFAGEKPGGGLLRLPPIDQRPTGAHPKNAPGDFYIVNTECTSCGYPDYVAPELIDWELDSEGRTHCFFRRQPETALELIHAVKAIEGSCCGAVCYRGSDPEVIQKLNEAGCNGAIDRTV